MILFMKILGLWHAIFRCLDVGRIFRHFYTHRSISFFYRKNADSKQKFIVLCLAKECMWDRHEHLLLWHGNNYHYSIDFLRPRVCETDNDCHSIRYAHRFSFASFFTNFGSLRKSVISFTRVFSHPQRNYRFKVCM